jgi:hypothetical protein
MQMIAADEFHMTDISFLDYAKRDLELIGGYNTIDTMFYEKGITDILKRRRTMLSFLLSLYHSNILYIDIQLNGKYINR